MHYKHYYSYCTLPDRHIIHHTYWLCKRFAKVCSLFVNPAEFWHMWHRQFGDALFAYYALLILIAIIDDSCEFDYEFTHRKAAHSRGGVGCVPPKCTNYLFNSTCSCSVSSSGIHGISSRYIIMFLCSASIAKSSGGNDAKKCFRNSIREAIFGFQISSLH